jgi:hypothetical protein
MFSFYGFVFNLNFLFIIDDLEGEEEQPAK